MKLTESFLLSLQNIRTSKARSFLTMLGIIIGITAVMVIVGIGNGMESYMRSMFQGLGTNTLTVSMTGTGTSRSVSPEDMQQIISRHSDVFTALSPTVTMRGTVKVGSETLSATSTTGVGEDYMTIKGYNLEQGRNLNYVDLAKRTRVCVVGNYIDDVWFSGRSVGQTLRIAGDKFTIVGALEQQEDEMDEGGSDDLLLIPYSTAARLSGQGKPSSYTVMLADEDQTSFAADLLEQELYESLRSEDAYRVSSMSVVLDTMTEMIGVVITVLAVIAGISLVVGGVGIMNIMLVSVTERTREIGIRKALGAKERYILSQFVIEAAVISALGGAIGIAMGFGLSSVATVAISNMLEVEMTVTPTVQSILVAFGGSAAIGILFGFLPARKAALLNPIDALRYD